MYKFTPLSRGRAVVARRAHNPKVAGSSPALATKTIKRLYYISVTVFLILLQECSFIQIQYMF